MFGITSFAEAPFASLGEAVTSVNVTGVFGTGQVGSVTVINIANISTNVTGVFGTTQLGTVSIVGKAVVSPTGVQATGFIGNVLIWGLIPDGQTPNWVAINDSQTPNWTAVNDGQTVTWVEVIT